jgi:hypothetical protein
VSPEYAAVAPGTAVTVTITSGNPNSGQESLFAGAALSNMGVSGANGQVTFTAPSARGCYIMKATGANQIRSNAFYLSIFE